MNVKALRQRVPWLACMAATVLASGATPPPVDETLDEVAIPGAREQERLRRPTHNDASWSDVFVAWRSNGATLVRLRPRGSKPPSEVSVLSRSMAMRLAPVNTPLPRLSREDNPVVVAAPPGLASRFTPPAAIEAIQANAVQLAGNRLYGFDKDNLEAWLELDDNIDEPEGLPASLAFGPHSTLLNLDVLRLRDARGPTAVTAMNAMHTQTGRCEPGIGFTTDARTARHAFVLLSDSRKECQRIADSRLSGDLMFAEGLPEKLRQEVLDVYGPIWVGLNNRLGSEPGLVFVAWWPTSPHAGPGFARGWDRSSLLLFHGANWQQGLDPAQRQALGTAFATEQVGRRFSLVEQPGVFVESAARYLLYLFMAEQQANTRQWLAGALPQWVTGCASEAGGRVTAARSSKEPAGIDCGLLMQFTYDCVARARSAGRNSLYDTWRNLFAAARRRGGEVANPASFMDSSPEARAIAQALLGGNVDWNRFVQQLDNFGVRLRLEQDASGTKVSVLSLQHFHD